MRETSRDREAPSPLHDQTALRSGRELGDPALSVVVCTYNRAAVLSDLLKTLSNQTVDASVYDIIVVDNNSTDETRTVVETFQQGRSNLSYQFEARQGLSHARNRGWRVAGCDYVAYVDDDCTVPPHWVARAIEVIQRVSPGVFGGPYEAYYNSSKPRWFKDSYESVSLGSDARVLEEGEYLNGTNIVFRRSLLETLDGFDTRFGMVGDTLGYAEETALLRAIRREYPRGAIYYDPRLCVSHLVRPEKMTLRWTLHRIIVAGRDSRRVFSEGEEPKNSGLRVWGAWALLIAAAVVVVWGLLLDIPRATVFRDRERYPYIENYLYEVSVQRLGYIGWRWGELVRLKGGGKQPPMNG
jgi:glycosyltransferase involved in cell wall biosynthesis